MPMIKQTDMGLNLFWPVFVPAHDISVRVALSSNEDSGDPV